MIMLIDKLLNSVVCFLFSVIFSLNVYGVGQGDFPDLFDQHGIIFKEFSDNSVIYVNKKGFEYKIPLHGVSFKGGDVALKKFVYDKLHDEYECNTRELFVIPFNNKLKIEEIRVVDIGVNNEPLNCKHKRDYINAIMKTKGKWFKTKNQQKYVYIFSMHIH